MTSKFGARRRWVVLSIVGLVLSAAAISACGSSDNGGNGGTGTSGGGSAQTIAVNQYSREIPYFQEILKGIQQSAGKLGWKVNSSFANNDPKQQIDQIQNAVTTQPNAMVVIPIDENAIIPPVQQAKSAGVPVATMGDNLGPAGQDAQLFFIGVNYETMGAQKAQWLVDQLKGQGTVGFIHGIRGLNFTEAQNRGAMAVFKKNPGIKIVDGGYTGAFTSDAGLKQSENLLTRNPNLNAIYFDNDDIALGGIQALKERNIPPSKVIVIGTDGGPAALKAVQAGTLDYTISLCGFKQGKDVIGVLQQYLVNKKTPPKAIYTKTVAFTPQNVAKEIKVVEAGQC
jgi:ABC-type sugar transport system substrate-binding protein